MEIYFSLLCFNYLFLRLRIQNEALDGKTDTNELENNLKGLRDYIKK